MKAQNFESFIAIEQALLERLVNNRVSISRPELAEIVSVSCRTVSNTNTRLTDSGRWEIAFGGGRSETTYTYLGE